MEWLIGLGILALVDWLNDRELPDWMVYLYFAYGIWKAWTLGNLALFFLSFVILYGLAKLGVFGTAEAYVLPVLIAVDWRLFLGALVIGILLSNLYLLARLWNKLKHKWLLLGLLGMWIHPIIGLVVLLVFMLLNREAFKLYRIIPREKALDEYSPEFGHIDKIERLPKKVRVRDSIPFFPFLFLGYLVELLYLATGGDLLRRLIIPYP
ncbi:MAG: hypothetical protein GXN92_03320 [Candidatus Micrarchaeota archaeon]|nr:hypothetical protein [Candidatus Micrarchaeota archaeon]